jgi:hypothetical protein
MKRLGSILIRPFVVLLAAGTPTCRRLVQQASQRLDSDSPRSIPLRTRAHLLICSACARYLRQLDLIHEASGQLAQKDTSLSKLPDASRTRIKARLRCDRS